MSSISKSGIILTSEMNESEGSNIVTYNTPKSYTPSTGTNSCLNCIGVLFTNSEITANTIIRCIATVSWNGFDTSNTAGTFNGYFQGSRHKIETDTWVWESSSPITDALNNQMNLKTLVLGTAKGSYTYQVQFTLADTWRATYDGQNVGFRFDYSNGTASISLDKLVIIYDKYSSNTTTKAHISNDFLAGSNIIEI